VEAAMKVLLVDDDTDLVDLLGYALRRVGYTVVTAFDGETALQTCEQEHPDLVLLDRVLPNLDGFEVCRRIRKQMHTPVILLTEHAAETDIIGGLDAGADDYVPKPFSARQLLARMQAVLRRYEPDPERLVTRELRAGELVLDPETHSLSRAGEPIGVTRVEFRLLYCLAVNEGLVVTYSRLIEHIWGYYGEVNETQLLKTHVSHLRRKLGLPRAGPGSIRSTLGVGYSLMKS
jgi:two-component system response regulator VicR